MMGKVEERIKRIKDRMALNAMKLAMLTSFVGVPAQTGGTNKAESKDTIEHSTKEIIIDQVVQEISQNEEALAAYCDDRSRRVSETFIETATEIHKEIQEHGSSVLQKRWNDKGINPRFYCVVSALNTLEESVQKTGCKEFSTVVDEIKKINPYGVYGPINRYFANEKNPHCKFINGKVKENLDNMIQDNPNDIFMVIHNSEQNNSSGFHAVTMANGMICGFNNEKVEKVDAYFDGSIKQAYILNLTKISQDANKDLLQQDFDKELREGVTDIHKASPVIQDIIAQNAPDIISSDNSKQSLLAIREGENPVFMSIEPNKPPLNFSQEFMKQQRRSNSNS